MDVDSLRIFLKVAELQSFTRAGDHLGLTKSRVSRALRALESQLDARLFHRSTRVVRLSPDGEALLPRARSIVQQTDEIGALFRAGRRLRGRVRVDLPLNLARSFVLPTLPAFLERHPELELFISTTDRLVDVLREGVDCVLRVGELSDSELVQRRLGELTMVNCVSRHYAERRGIPEHLDALDDHQLVHYVTGLHFERPAFEYVLDGRTLHRPMRSAVTVNGTDAYRAACHAGLGIIQVPRLGVRESLASGALVEILPDHRCAPMPVSLLHGHGPRAPARVRAVMDWIGESLARHLL